MNVSETAIDLLNEAAQILATTESHIMLVVDEGSGEDVGVMSVAWKERLGAFAHLYSQWFAQRTEDLKEHCPECGAGAPVWKLKNKSKDWGDLGTGPRFHCDACDAYRVIPTSAVGQK